MYYANAIGIPYKRNKFVTERLKRRTRNVEMTHMPPFPEH